MPKIKSYTPSWLSKPAPGHQLFTPTTKQKATSLSTPNINRNTGARRTIARRGSEVFIAVGKEIRWGDLVYLKESWEEKQARGRSGVRIKREDSDDNDLLRSVEENGHIDGFRTIKVPIADDIRQLIISPHSNFLAILTTHTVKICLLPDSSHLTAPGSGEIKPKTWTLGPTTHVNNRSAIASALWHPLGVNGSCLVTVTRDAVVRVWELSPSNTRTFDSATLGIDLKKLADGTSLDQNFTAADITSKIFSPDAFEMEVAAATFAGKGSGGWSPMTLWVAMREGDVYALCPLLPSKWAPPPTLIPSLSVGIVANLAAVEDDPAVSEGGKLLAQQQLDWMSDLDNQDPTIVEGPPGEPPTEIYTRPSRPGIVPKLQGPFDFELSPDSEDDLDNEITDILAIGEKLDTEELMLHEDEELDLEEVDREGLSLSVIALLSTSGQVRVCLDLEGIQAQWLPPKGKAKSSTRLLAEVEPPSLLVFQALDTLAPLEVVEDAWPSFSTDVTSRYAFYVTHPGSITYISLAPWIFRLEGELQGESQAGSDFRIDLLVKGQGSTRERLFTNPSQGDEQTHLTASVAIRDPDLGYFLLSATPYDPVAMVFDTPEYDFTPIRASSEPVYDREAEVKPLDFYEPRPVFRPPHTFEESSALPALLEKLRTSRHKTLIGQEIRLSPLTLQVFTDAHKVLSDETHRLGIAASELFRRCERLQIELREQIAKASEVKTRVEAITGEDQLQGDGADSGEPESTNAAIERRVQTAKERGESLAARLEKLRRTVNKATSRELSDKERAWINEVKNLENNVIGPGSYAAAAADEPPKTGIKPWKRFEDLKLLTEDLLAEAQELQKAQGGAEEQRDEAANSLDLRIPSGIRRAKVNQVKGLLERETALIEAVKARLERLSVG